MITNPRPFTAQQVRLAGMLADATGERTGLFGPGLFFQVFTYVLQHDERFNDLLKQIRALDEIKQNTRKDTALIHDVLNSLETQESRYQLIQYQRETVSCRQKERLWEEMDLKKGLAFHLGKPIPLGMMKSIVMKYEREGEERYIVACTLADKLVDAKELRVEFGLSGAEYKTLTHQGIDDISLLLLTGKEKGEIGPLMIDRKLSAIEGVYFAEDLMQDAEKHPSKLYDVPLTKQHSLFVNAHDLFQVLRQRNQKYRANSAREGNIPLEVTDWKVRDVVLERAGVSHLFTGTKVRFRGQDYMIKNPPKEAGCIALPIPLEADGIRNQRVVLPISYSMMEERYNR